MSSQLVTDLEKGVAVLIHDLPGEIIDVSGLPADALEPLDRFATNLGLDPAKLEADAKGVLFHWINTAVEAVSGPAEGHAQAGAPSAPVEPPPAPTAPTAPETAPETAPAPAKTDAQIAVATQEAVKNASAPPEHGPADTDLPPVTDPKAGYEVCPKCAGFRTILDAGKVVVCPQCDGAGEILAASAA